MRIFGSIVLWLLSLAAIGVAGYGAWEGRQASSEYFSFIYGICGAIFILGLTLIFGTYPHGSPRRSRSPPP